MSLIIQAFYFFFGSRMAVSGDSTKAGSTTLNYIGLSILELSARAVIGSVADPLPGKQRKLHVFDMCARRYGGKKGTNKIFRRQTLDG